MKGKMDQEEASTTLHGDAGLQQENPKPDLHGRKVLVPEALRVTRLKDSKGG